MYVFRIHIRPEGGTADMKTTFDYCLKNGLLGVGWRVEEIRETKIWSEYFELAKTKHKDLNNCKYIKTWVSVGDLVWTRDNLGQYYIARVNSAWEYFTSEESETADIDIGNVFRCEIKKVEIDEVPGKVIACFRASRSIQEVADKGAVEYSKYLWNRLCGEAQYQINTVEKPDVFMLLDSQEAEDILFLYLQQKGWYVIPHSRKADTMTFEYLCVNPETGQIAGTQVKTGETYIQMDAYTPLSNKVFLFQSNERYQGLKPENVEVISKNELMDFMKDSVSWLPKVFKRKMELAKMV
jgi:hypothetical protein